VVLVVLGVLTLVMALFFRESLAEEDRMEGSLLHSFTGLAVVARNGRFMVFMLATSLFVALPFNCYLTLAPYIYEGVFNLTPLEYSYFFAATAGFSAVGLLVYRLVSARVSLKHLTTVIIACAGLSGLLTVTVGHMSAFIFFAAMLLLQATGMVVRPYATNILFDLQKDDTGSASAVMNCSFTIIGSLGMLPAMLIGSSYLGNLGALICIGFAASMILWFALLRSKAAIPRIKD
jgi:DHA1 family bicyclomycin/chloramphenicol resistance-like MFS transporter